MDIYKRPTEGIKYRFNKDLRHSDKWLLYRIPDGIWERTQLNMSTGEYGNHWGYSQWVTCQDRGRGNFSFDGKGICY